MRRDVRVVVLEVDSLVAVLRRAADAMGGEGGVACHSPRLREAKKCDADRRSGFGMSPAASRRSEKIGEGMRKKPMQRCKTACSRRADCDVLAITKA